MLTVDRTVACKPSSPATRTPRHFDVVQRFLAVLSLLPTGMAFADDDPDHRVSVRLLKQESPSARYLAASTYDAKRQRMLVFGGGNQDDPQARRGLLCLDLRTDRWSVMKVPGVGPKGFGGPSMVYVEREDALYVFGGWPKEADKPTAELWTLSLRVEEELRWQLISHDGDGPPGRNGCCMVVDAKRNRLVLHGGDGGPHPVYGFRPLDDLWEFDLVRKRWRRLEPTGTVPEPRWNHAVALDQKKGVMYLFGGAGYVGDRLVADRDIFALDLEGLEWRRLATQKDRAWPVQGTSLTYDSHLNLLLVVGGLSLAPRGSAGPRSVWTFDPKTDAWTRHKRVLPTTRRDHVSVYDPIRKRHVIFGGAVAAVRGNYYAKGKQLANALVVTIEKQ